MDDHLFVDRNLQAASNPTLTLRDVLAPMVDGHPINRIDELLP